MRTTLVQLALFVMIIGATPALGQQSVLCTDVNESLQTCFNHYVAAIPAQAAGGEADKVEETVSEANTGLSTLSSASGSTVRDFLSILSASLQSSNFNAEGQTLTLDWNVPVWFLDRKDQVKVQAVLAQPQISGQLAESLGSNAAAVTALNDSLQNLDDITASLTYNPVSTRFGRSIAPHRDLYESMLISAVDKVARPDANRRFRAFLRQFNVTDPSQTFLQLATAAMPAGDLLVAANEAFAAQQAMNKAFVSLSENFALLLNNQPQRYVSVLYHERKDIVGPDEWKAKLTWEFGSQNLNKFYANDGRGCDDPAIRTNQTLATSCLQNFNTYVTRTGAASRASTDRFALSAEYHSSSSTSVDLPEYSVTFDTNGGHSLVYEAKYGRSFDPTMGKREGRIDVSVNYEDVSDDPLKKDRFVGAVTYTLKISDALSVPVSLLYANHEQFLSPVDRKLNAHFGLVYKVPKM